MSASTDPKPLADRTADFPRSERQLDRAVLEALAQAPGGRSGATGESVGLPRTRSPSRRRLRCRKAEGYCVFRRGGTVECR